MKELILDESDEKFEFSVGRAVRASLLNTDFKTASWGFTIKSIILWGGSFIIVPTCIILSKLMKQDIDLFKYEN